MKILIYTPCLGNGGAERVAALWANGLAGEGHKVCILLEQFVAKNAYEVSPDIKVLKSSLMYDKMLNVITLKKPNVLVYRLANKLFNLLPICICQKCIANVIKRQSPDVIIVTLQGLFNQIRGALNKTKLKIPIIVTDHNSYERPSYAPFSAKQEQEKFVDIKKYDYMTVLTRADWNVLKDRVDETELKKVFVMPNPLTFPPAPMVPLKEKVILAAGRLNVWHCKGFDLLLKAWAKIQRDFPEWKLKIAGGGNAPFLKELCSDLTIIDRVEFLGFVDLKKQYEKASIFVLSSRYEGFGMVLTEAMSQGCACIACDYKGRQSEIIVDDSQGVLCPTDDENAIADALRRVITDDGYRHMLQENAIERSKFYELPNIVNRWNGIFKKIGLFEEKNDL